MVELPMLLTLSILTYRNQPVPLASSARFSAAGGAVGRATENVLVLDDPGKYISRTHAQVAFRDGAYFLEDVGSNPSVVNDRPLGKGRAIALADGDRIVIGDYQLEARLVVAAPAAPVLAPAPFNDTGLPLFEPAPLPPPPPLPPLEPVVAALAPPAFVVGGFDALAAARILAVGPDDHAGAGLADPLGLNLFGAAAAAPPAVVVPGDLGLDLAPQFRAAESDHVSPELVPFQLPAAAPRPAGGFAIPDDYDPLADFLPPPVVNAVNLNAVTPAQAGIHSTLGMDSRLRGNDSFPVCGSRELDATALPPVVVAVASAAPVAAPAAAPAAGDSDSAVLQALLRGLGLPDLQLNRSGVQVAETVGAMLREATAGTMDVLMARALTKKESRIDMTMISASANNPLKFFPNPESALTQMLTNTMAGYMAPVPAMHSAFDDLRAHELAVIAGMRAALAAVLQRFDPVHIESRQGQPSALDKMLVAQRKAKLWDGMVAQYGEIAREADDDMQRLFGEKFSAAYEEQVERLRRAGK